jgi:L-ascorbate metabolism protein UlaG (beta-lactamase superfamily)
MGRDMQVTYIGHSGFAIETSKATLIFDYFNDINNVLPPILQRATNTYVFVSHSHQDHLNQAIFTWNKQYNITRYIISSECQHKLRHTLDLSQLPVTALHHDEDYNDDNIAVHSFNSTDIGISYLITVDGKKIFHAGDLNNWHWKEESTPQEIKKAEGDFLAILRDIKAYTSEIDLAMFPVDPSMGDDFARGANQLVNAIKVGTFIPMHMWGHDKEAAQFELYRNKSYGDYIHLNTGDSITI